MKLLEKQQLFTACVAKLLVHAEKLGYRVTLGDAYRDPRVHGDFGMSKSYSSPYSVHKLRLAIDLNLFKDGIYMTDTKEHLLLGTYWETLHPLARWGGDFNDGNHYSFEHNGKM